jgi:hypothetical protein
VLDFAQTFSEHATVDDLVADVWHSAMSDPNSGYVLPELEHVLLEVPHDPQHQ